LIAVSLHDRPEGRLHEKVENLGEFMELVVPELNGGAEVLREA
jgi:hypothetical protein